MVEKDSHWWYKDGCFGPICWPEADGCSLAYYQLVYCGYNTYWLLHSSGERGRGLGLALVLERSLYKKKNYKELLETFYKKNAKVLTGVDLLSPCLGTKKPYLVFPIMFKLEELADNYPDWEDFIAEKVKLSFELLVKVHPTINTFIESLN